MTDRLNREVTNATNRLLDGLTARKLGHYAGAVMLAAVAVSALVDIASALQRLAERKDDD